MDTRLFIKTAGNFLFITGFGLIIFTYMPIIYSEVSFWLNPPSETVLHEEILNEPRVDDSGFDYYNITPVIPVDDKFSVIIEKIGVNVPVVQDVTTVNKREYTDALRKGVAHAKGTALPGKPGNMFLFAHSSINFWSLGKYAMVFNLLRKVEAGDHVIVFYNGKGYVYEVFEAGVVNGWNTKPFDMEYDEPVVTLVTCYPPGATINRYVVKAKLL